MPEATPFNVRALYALKTDVQYRIYSRPGEVYFIRIGGQGASKSLGVVLRRHLGLLGLLVAMLFGVTEEKAAKRRAEKDRLLDARDPRGLMQTNKGSFVQRIPDIVKSSIEQPDIFGGHGTQFGKWLLEFRDGRKERLQFETIPDMTKALASLPLLLGDTLAVNVEWNPKLELYEKRPAAASPAKRG